MDIGLVDIDTGDLDKICSNTEQELCIGSEDDPPPIAALPTEVLATIFRTCVNGEPIHLPPDSTMTAPWGLGHVCSSWREIFKADPIIWSSLILSYEDIDDREAFTRWVKEAIFPRISCDLMSLTCLGSDYVHDSKRRQSGDTLTTLIIPNLARFRHLSLSMICTAMEVLISSQPRSCGSLASLELEFLPDTHDAAEGIVFGPGSLTVFEHARNLRKVCLKGRSSSFTIASPLNLPWGQLKELDVSIQLSLAVFAQFLPSCTQLVCCKLNVGGNPVPYRRITRFTLPQLRSACLRFDSFHTCSSLLEMLILPSMRSLSLALDFGSRLSMEGSLLALLARSMCLLESFEVLIFSFTIPFNNIPALLEAMPSLRKLFLPYTIPLCIPVIRRMIKGELVPHLEVMHCAVESLWKTLDLLEVRNSGGSPGALESYRGIRCAAIWRCFMMKCNCEN